MHSFDEQRSRDCYNDEINNTLFVVGNAVLRNLLHDFRRAGIRPATFLHDLKSSLHLFPHELNISIELCLFDFLN